MSPARTPVFRYAALDLLRLFAAVSVMAYHFTFHGFGNGWAKDWAFPEIDVVTRYGFLGVNLFFIISGFVIALSAENAKKSAFVRARLARIYPAFVICMTFTSLVEAVYGHGVFEIGLRQWAANLVIVPSLFHESFVDGVYWTIVREVIFYSWAAFLLTGVWQVGRIKVILSLWLVLCAADGTLFHLSFTVRSLLLTEWAPHFSLGIMIYLFSTGRGDRFIAALFAGAFLLGLRQTWLHPLSDSFLALTGVSKVVLAIIHTLIVGSVMLAAAFATRIPSRTSWIMLGGLTYPLYLIHENVGELIYARAVGGAGRWPALLLASLVVLMLAYMVWRFLEPLGRRAIFYLFDRVMILSSAQPFFAG